MKEGLERERERKGERKEERIYKSVLATGRFSGEGEQTAKEKERYTVPPKVQSRKER